MVKVDFSFRSKLDEMIGGSGHSACFQCGACVGDCPGARYSERFNPRRIMLTAVLGLADRLVTEDSVVWDCTNCCNCIEHCPQDVRPMEVIIAIKNMIRLAHLNPEKIDSLVGSVHDTGRTVVMSDLIHKRRRELNLPELAAVPVAEIAALLRTDDK
jgi:heterodisulfide reductase subunit C